jgi:selenocysteine-specific elongation factor
MRSFIVGTAGHIDHGKSALVRALTGTDPDRLKEEKERGITIDLGFAHATLADGIVASFIDVPGHERFVRNMLAGAFGIDAVLLVVAADESVMPQTREHFHICRLLGIPRGLVALSRCDVADAESQALAELEVRELVRGSFLEGRPIVRVSAKSGQGLDELRSALLVLAREAPARTATGLLRLPVDRVFTLRGFGTVVTGTVLGGAVETGDDVEVLPAGRRARVRGLQVHGKTATRVTAGSRAAVNLSGVDVADLARGDVLTHVGVLRGTSMLDVELTLLPGGSPSGSFGSPGWSAKPLRDQARVRVHFASAEVLGRVRVLDGPAIEPGQSSLAQLRLEKPALAGRGDLLVVRSYSPSFTIGGARVLDPLPPKRRRGSTVPHLRVIQSPDLPRGRVAALFIEAAGVSGLAASELAARLAVPVSSVELALADEPSVKVASRDPTVYVSRSGLEKLSSTLLDALTRFHATEPLRPGMPREELRERFAAAVPGVVFEATVLALVRGGRVRVAAETLALSGHSVSLGPREQEAQTEIEAAARAAGLAGVEARVLGERLRVEPKLLERLVRLLLDAGTLRRLSEGMLVHREHLDELKRRVRDRWPAGTPLEVPAFKDMTGLTRKHVIPLLEYLDRERVTRRVGAERTVL